MMNETRIPVLCAQTIVTAMLLTSVGLAVPRLADDVGLNMAMRGNIISAQYVGATIAVIIGGIFCDMYGRAFMAKIFMLVTALVSLFFGIVWNYPSAVFASFALGATTNTLENAIMSSGLDLGKKSRIGNALIQTSFSVGAILIPLLYLLWMQFEQWRPVYYTLAAFFAVGFVFAKGSFNKTDSGNFVGRLMKYGLFLKKPSYFFGPLLLFLYVAAEIGLWSFAPTFFEAAEYGKLSGIISSLLIWIMMLVGRIVSTALIKKLPIMYILISFGLCGIAAYVCIMVFTGSVALFFTAVAGLACAPFYALLISLATEVSGDNSSSYIAFAMGAGTLGPALLGGVGGKLGQEFGAKFVMLPALISFALLVAILIVFTLSQKRKQGK